MSSPSLDNICTVDVFLKCATFNPEYSFAPEAVGGTWLVPDA